MQLNRTKKCRLTDIAEIPHTLIGLTIDRLMKKSF